ILLDDVSEVVKRVHRLGFSPRWRRASLRPSSAIPRDVLRIEYAVRRTTRKSGSNQGKYRPKSMKHNIVASYGKPVKRGRFPIRGPEFGRRTECLCEGALWPSICTTSSRLMACHSEYEFRREANFRTCPSQNRGAPRAWSLCLTCSVAAE